MLCALAPAVMAAPALRDLAGQARAIADYTGHGKWLVVMIWASDCRVCNADAHNYVALHNAHHEKDITLLGISMDGWAHRNAAKAFIRRHRVSFPNLIGEPQAVADLYSELTDRPWFGTPTFLIFDPSGKLRAQQVGAVPVRLIEQFIAGHSARGAHGQSARTQAGGDLAWVRYAAKASLSAISYMNSGGCPIAEGCDGSYADHREQGNAIWEFRGAKYTGMTRMSP